MEIEEIYGAIFDKAKDIQSGWQRNKYSSKKIRNEIKFNFFRNKKVDFIEKMANFYAFYCRFCARYNNVFKIFFRYFSWKKDSKLLGKIKQFLKCPDQQEAREIILLAAQRWAGGDDLFDVAADNKNGVTLQNANKAADNEQDKTRSHENVKTIKDEVKLVDKESNIACDTSCDNAKDDMGRDLAARDGVDMLPGELLDAQKDKENAAQFDTNFYHLNQEPLDIAPRANYNKGEGTTRERLEISNTFDKPCGKVGTKKLVKSVDAKVIENGAENMYVDNAPAPAQAAGRGNNATQVTGKADIATQCDKLAENAPAQKDGGLRFDRQKTTISTQKIDETRRGENENNYLSRIAQAERKNEISERQRGEIAGEEIAKISEKDMQAIKDYMQEELNRQMDIAEKNGEIYKMPLTVSEAIPPVTKEKSAVSYAKCDTSTLKKDK